MAISANEERFGVSDKQSLLEKLVQGVSLPINFNGELAVQ